MTFKLAARIVAAILGVLFIILAVFPAVYMPTYGVAADEGVQFMARRAAPMFLAPAVILWAAANAPRGGLRDVIAWSVGITLFGVAGTGILAFAQAIASPVIILAAAGECLMGAALIATRKN